MKTMEGADSMHEFFSKEAGMGVDKTALTSIQPPQSWCYVYKTKGDNK